MALLVIGCKPEIQCTPPSSELFYVVIIDSLGNNTIEQQYSGLTLNLSDNNSTFNVVSEVCTDASGSHLGWKFNPEELESGFPYLLYYDSTTVDTITVQLSLKTIECDGSIYTYKVVETLQYNGTVFNGQELKYFVLK